MNSVKGRMMLLGLVCALCAAAWIVVGLWHKMPPILLCSVGAALSVVAIILVVMARATPTPGAEPMGLCCPVEPTHQLYWQSRQALARCAGPAKRWSPKRRGMLHKRPWFLLMGPSGGGKSALLNGSGLRFTQQVLSPGGGDEGDDSQQIGWHVSADALWIDTPGAFVADENGSSWRALAAALRRLRRRGPVDGVGVVVDVNFIVDEARDGVKAAAAQLRRRIDELREILGMDFSLYLVFNHLDSLPGFDGWLGSGRERAQEQLFGAALSGVERGEARALFEREFEVLCSCLATDRLGKLHAREDDAGKRQICNFVIQFEALQEKLACFVGELFKSSPGAGGAHLSGFYFTCAPCFKTAPVVTPQPAQGVLSKTIVNHPLNPHPQPKRYEPLGASDAASSAAQALFVRPLLAEVMVGSSGSVGPTPERLRQNKIQAHLVGALAVLLMMVFMVSLMSARQHTSRRLAALATALSEVGAAEGSLERHYGALGLLGEQMGTLDRMHSKPALFSAGFSSAQALQQPLEQLYFEKLRRFVLVPSRKYLEYTMLTTINQNSRLDGEQYRRLYTALKSYLSITETALTHRAQLDTSALRMQLVEAVTRSVLVTLGSSRLPQHIERVVGENVGVYLRLHALGRAPLLQADQQLLAQARVHLTCLPDAQTLYRALVNRLSTQAAELSVAAVAGVGGDGVLRCSATISALYTPQGWEQFVSPAIEQACKNPFSLDWVVAGPEGQSLSTSFDKKQMRQAMVEGYAQDYRQQWLRFLGAVEVTPPSDVQSCATLLRDLRAPDGEVQRVLEAVVAKTLVSLPAPGASLVNKAVGEAVKLKGEGVATEQIAALSQQLLSGEQESFKRVVQGTFVQLQTLLQPPAGAGFGLAQYRERLGGVVDALERMQGGESPLSLFNGREHDPLEALWDATVRGLAGVDPQLAAALEGVLFKPLSATGQVVAPLLAEELNARWHGEVVTPFATRLAGRYPFNQRGEDAAYGDVMDFFRPATGIFWGFYERVLCGYVNKRAEVWQLRTDRCINLSLERGVLGALGRAERIGTLFFHPSGEERVFTLSIAPLGATAQGAQLVVDGQIVQLQPGGVAQNFYWPRVVESRQGSLQVRIDERCVQGFSFVGPWAMMKLMGQARLSIPSPGTLDATWGVNVQNMYTVYQKYRLRIVGGEHPFGKAVFEGFDCPVQLCRSGAGSN